jgi:hypothetical protein
MNTTDCRSHCVPLMEVRARLGAFMDRIRSLAVKEWATGQARNSMRLLMEEARALMASGDAATAAAMDFARRFRVTTEQLKSSEPPALTALRPKLKVMMHDAQSNPDLSHKLEVFGFVEKALANLKAKEDKG